MATIARVFRVALPLALGISIALPAAAGQTPSSTQLTITVSDPSGAPRSFDVQLTRVF